MSSAHSTTQQQKPVAPPTGQLCEACVQKGVRSSEDSLCENCLLLRVASTHLSQAKESSTEDALRQLELGSKLLKELVEAIRASNAQQDPQIISMIRNAGSFEELEKDLRRFKDSLRGADDGRGESSGKAQLYRTNNDDSARAPAPEARMNGLQEKLPKRY